MSWSPRTAVALAATSVALNARTGQLDALDVGGLQVKAEQLLADRTDPLFRAVSAFATGYELHRYDAAEVARLGDDLERAILLAVQPDPPDLARVDIHG